jgi:hypothetical protein
MRLTGQVGLENRGVILFLGFAAAVLNAGNLMKEKTPKMTSTTQPRTA